MKYERRVTLVLGYEPAFGRPPADVAEAGLTATIGVVLSTYRADGPDSVRDHALWRACVHAVTEVVGAEEAEVYGEAPPGLLNRLLHRRIGSSLGTLVAYGAQLSNEAHPPDWAFIRWKRSGMLVAAGMSEPWDRVGGRHLYHDSYTTCVFIAPPVSAALVQRISLTVAQEGGHIDSVVDLAGHGTA